MSEIIKIGMFGIVGVLLAVQFKVQKPEFGILIGAVIAVMLFGFAVGQMEAVIGHIRGINQYLGASGEYLSVLLKVIGITYICEFSAGICKDAGYQTVSDQIEIMGKLSVMFVGLPILLAVIGQIQEMW